MSEATQQEPVTGQNLTALTEATQSLWEQLLNQQSMQQQAFSQMQLLSKLYTEFATKLLEDPNKITALSTKYWQAYWALCTRAFSEYTAEVQVESKQFDKRFRDKDWHADPYFRFLKDFYLMTVEHIQYTLSQVEGLDEATTQKLTFYTQQFLDALAPTNFPLSNPEVWRKTLETQGQNLLMGMTNLVEDLKDSEGFLKIKMSDLNAFEVGKDLAVTPGKVVFQNHLFQLLQYEATTEKVFEVPLLMIPPWINKYYILDLSARQSFVKWIVSQGFTVFMVSWVNPDERHKTLDFEDYLTEGVLEAVEYIRKSCKVETVNTLGFCIGGTLLGATLAYLAKQNDTRIKSATYLATLLDFSDPGDIAAFIDETQIEVLEALMEEKGYLDGGHLSTTFNMLRANDLIWSCFIKNYLLGEEPFPFDMLYWNSDSTNLPAKMHSTYLRNMYLHNNLIQKDAMQLAGVPIDLRRITTPAYFLSTQHDHIAPWQTTYKGACLHSGPTTFVLGGSGHIAGVINPPSSNKYHYRLNEHLETEPNRWFDQTETIEGSWWPHWGQWLASQSGEKMLARKLATQTLEDAPGSYVLKKIG